MKVPTQIWIKYIYFVTVKYLWTDNRCFQCNFGLCILLFRVTKQQCLPITSYTVASRIPPRTRTLRHFFYLPLQLHEHPTELGYLMTSQRTRGDLVTSQRNRGDLMTSQRNRGDLMTSPKNLGDLMTSPKNRGDLMMSLRNRGDLMTSPRNRSELMTSLNNRGDLVTSSRNIYSLNKILLHVHQAIRWG